MSAGKKRSSAKPPLSPVPTPHAAPSTSNLPPMQATLVICPLVAVIQWRQEIARFTTPGSLKVLVVHTLLSSTQAIPEQPQQQASSGASWPS